MSEVQSEPVVCDVPVAEVAPVPTSSDLPEEARIALERSLGRLSGRGGLVSDPNVVVESMRQSSEPVRQASARLIRQMGVLLETARSGAELAEHMASLEADYRLALASVAESVSVENRETERQVLNTLAILDTATKGRADDVDALHLEVLNQSAESLFDEDTFEDFAEMLRERMKNQLVQDVGYNAVILPLEFGSPDASDAQRASQTDLLDKLMELGNELGVMFFVDAARVGIVQAETEPRRLNGRRLSKELDRVLAEFDWQGSANLGSALQMKVKGQRKSQFLVLSGGTGLLAQRKADEDFPDGIAAGPGVVAPTALAVSSSALAAGVLAWAAGGDGLITLSEGESEGTGGLGVTNTVVPADKHHNASRQAAVNISFMKSQGATPTFDTAVTLQSADPSFKKSGRGSIESVVMEQLICRLLRRLLVQFGSKPNVRAQRFERVVTPLRTELKALREQDHLVQFDVSDETTRAMEAVGQLFIKVDYQEARKVDRAIVQIERTINWGGDHGQAGTAL